MLKIVQDKINWQNIFSKTKDKSVLCSYTYVKAASELEEGGEACLAVFSINNNFVVHPYIKRKINGFEYFDIISVYDFGGFWFNCESRKDKIELIKEFDKAFTEYCINNLILCEFIRLNPFFDHSLLLKSEYIVEHVKDNIILDLSDKSFEQIYKDFSPTRRNKIYQGIKKNNLTLVKENDINKFIDIYYKNLDRLSASQFYYFSKSFFKKCINFFDVFYVYDQNNEISGGHIYLKDYNKYFVYLTAGVTNKLGLRPNCFCYYNTIKIAQEKKYKVFHFGGGSESLYDYKKSFSKEIIPYYTVKKIFDKKLYKKVVNQTKLRENEDVVDDFFPEYRQFDLQYKPLEKMD